MTLMIEQPQAAKVSAATAPPIEPMRHRWTPDEFVQMIKAGLFVGRGRAELIDGEIFDVPPQNNPHVAGISRTTRLFAKAFDDTLWLTVQSTVRLPRGDMPEPDFAIRPGPESSDNDYQPLPLLIVEVSDDTLLSDQTVKSSLYAANGILDYWILNVKDMQVEVYRNPVADRTRRHGFRYASVNTFLLGSKISPLAFPALSFEVERMLPPAS